MSRRGWRRSRRCTASGREIREGGVQLLGTSGTVTTLAGVALGLSRYRRPLVDGTVLTRRCGGRGAGRPAGAGAGGSGGASLRRAGPGGLRAAGLRGVRGTGAAVAGAAGDRGGSRAARGHAAAHDPRRPEAGAGEGPQGAGAARAGGGGADGEGPQRRLAALAGPAVERSLRGGGEAAGLSLACGVQAGGTGRAVPPDPARIAGRGSGCGAGRLDTGGGAARRGAGGGGGPAGGRSGGRGGDAPRGLHRARRCRSG